MKRSFYCQGCQYYFMTWEPSTPHGCKLFGFKAKQHPSMVVEKSSGDSCHSYKAKKRSKDLVG